jgi:hypothetical protein
MEETSRDFVSTQKHEFEKIQKKIVNQENEINLLLKNEA